MVVRVDAARQQGGIRSAEGFSRRGEKAKEVVPYSEGFKSRMVQRMSGPEGVSASMLSADVGVGQPTLSRWLRESGTGAVMMTRKRQRKKQATISESKVGDAGPGASRR